MKYRQRTNRLHYVYVLFLTLFLGVATAAKAPWKMEEFPKPNFGLIADPDHLLSEQSLQKLADSIDDITDKVEVPIQIAVAVASKMHIPKPNNIYEDDRDNVDNGMDEDAAAEKFARGLHDRWGVGTDGESGGTGVLVFLSVDDRVVYISRGSSFDVLLRNSRIDSIIQDLRPSLRQAKYGEGLSLAVELIGTYIQKGEPKWDEWIWDYFRIEYLLLSGYGLAIYFSMRQARRRREAQRVYAEAASQLSAIDRAQAEALQGQFNASSCPICLEDFVSNAIGSDERPIKLLRCGHVFDASCWEEWVNSGQGQVSKCPICKKDVGVGESSISAAAAGASGETVGEQPPQADTMVAVDDTSVQQNEQHIHHHHHHHNQRNRAMQLFQQDRNFRLARLALRYPNVVTQQQVQRWSSPTYNGQLTQDRSFVESRPRAPEPRSYNSNNRMGGSSASFGGGTSSGGRGGRF
eukprot:CAMPEP_0113659736 /NCGR_PEP_ID=MMETSP0017_2-20120614/32523_1 /TAXON_ID=2856 /ORGANISM="Cylindrotheca closterium" /LENGTH=463 /DNA_ID=CAMNT_0000574319 /DNA_START=47 /DNA_END=1438 /DNA_ORIENTATION=+ /assembly_acc=CAM_ASM_000147